MHNFDESYELDLLQHNVGVDENEEDGEGKGGGRLGPVEQIMRKAIHGTQLSQNVTRKYFEKIYKYRFRYMEYTQIYTWNKQKYIHVSIYI